MTNRISSKEQEELILKNLKFVHYVIRKMNIFYSDYDDIVSIGNIGLIKAASSFDKSKGLSFLTYASRCIKNEILMYFRKENKYPNIISLDDVVARDKYGNEMVIADSLAAPVENFEETLVNREEVIRIISIILNLLNSRERTIMLYQIAGKPQNVISEIVKITQAQISRIIKKLKEKIKSYFNNPQQYKEVYKMEIVGASYKISFSSKDIKNFNHIFAKLLQKLTSTKELPDFKVSCNRERVIIQVPAHPQSFYFIAQIIQQIEDYSLSFLSEKSQEDKDNILKEVKTNIRKDVKESVLEESEQIISDNLSTFIEADKNILTDTDSVVKCGTNTKQVRDYILGKENFTFKELKEHFPNIKLGTIASILNEFKNRGRIVSTGRGKYTTKKN